MKILVDLTDELTYLSVDIKSRYAKIIDSFVNNQIFSNISLVPVKNDKLLYAANQEFISLLIEDRYQGWLHISEESQFLCIFHRRPTSAGYFYPKELYQYTVRENKRK